MTLAGVETERPGYDLRAFEGAKCHNVDQSIVEYCNLPAGPRLGCRGTESSQLGVITMRWMILPYLFAAAIIAAQFPALAQAVDGDAASGREIATKQCSSCHRVLPMTLADKADPPSFQSLADLPSTTGISLNAFLHSNHKNMPDFIISSAESNDLIAYILSLKKH